MPELSIVIPAYCEASRLGSTLDEVLRYVDSRAIDAEIIVVDDGSPDETLSVAQGFEAKGVKSLRLARNRGKGAALRHGVAASSGERILVTDADLSTPIEEIEILEPHLSEDRLVFGSRATSQSSIDVRQPFYREWMGRIFNLFVRMRGIGGLGDTQCGFKLLPGGVGRKLFSELTVDRFAYDVELVWLARRRGYDVVEVGVVWNHSNRSRVRLLRDSSRMLWDILRFPRRHR